MAPEPRPSSTYRSASSTAGFYDAATVEDPRRPKLAGWGYEGDGLRADEREALTRTLRVAFPDAPLRRAGRRPRVELTAPRIGPPRGLEELLTADPRERALHALGKGYPDLVRAFRGEFPHAPDLVAYPAEESDVARLLDWAAEARVAIVPFGGGSSVVGGVEPDVGDAYRAASASTWRGWAASSRWTRSRVPRVQAGTRGPSLEQQLAAHGLTSGTTRSRSSTPRSAAGSRRARADTSPPDGRTWTTSSRGSASSRRAGRSRRGGCGNRRRA